MLLHLHYFLVLYYLIIICIYIRLSLREIYFTVFKMSTITKLSISFSKTLFTKFMKINKQKYLTNITSGVEESFL